ncbi:MAG: DUF1616 domain-containing protein [Thermoplasmata archaeon]|nr:DUF1616 domain-containing protein [Thermoplasmata archaeon]
MVLDTVEFWTGGLLLFALPGYAWTRALFPEWKIRGPHALDRAVRTGTLAFVWSLSFVVVVGSILSEIPSLGFSAAWSNPRLELILAGLSAIGFVVAFVRGAFRRVGDEAPFAALPGEDSPLPWLREFDRLEREERRLRRALARSAPDSEGARLLTTELDRLKAESRTLRRRREDEYAR